MSTTTGAAPKSGVKQFVIILGAVLIALFTFQIVMGFANRSADARFKEKLAKTANDYAAKTDRDIATMQKGGGMKFNPNAASTPKSVTLFGQEFTGLQNFTKFPDGPTLEEAVTAQKAYEQTRPLIEPSYVGATTLYVKETKWLEDGVFNIYLIYILKFPDGTDMKQGDGINVRRAADGTWQDARVGAKFENDGQ